MVTLGIITNLIPLDLNSWFMKSLFSAVLSTIIFLGMPKSFAAENIVLITFDGLRWQEVFNGIDRRIATHKDFSPQSEIIMRRFWRSSPQERAKLLLPFMHDIMFKEGTYIGDRKSGSCAEVTNQRNFSYPGYSEILTGVVNETINSNDKFPNPEQTFLELLNGNEKYLGKSAAFASWDVFPSIFNVNRSGLHVNAFSLQKDSEPEDQFEEFLTQLQNRIPTPWSTVRHDAFTHYYALSYLQRVRPKVLFISYGETDDFAHDGKYDQYILAANRTDSFIQEIWDTIQTTEGYRDNTVLFVSVDHGRGELPLETWRYHGEEIAGSEAVWIAAMGPNISNSGLINTGSECVGSNGIAATLLKILGEDYMKLNPKMGSPIGHFLE